MALFKRALVSTMAVSSTSVYMCSNCGYTDLTEEILEKDKICPECRENMKIIQVQAQPENNKENT